MALFFLVLALPSVASASDTHVHRDVPVRPVFWWAFSLDVGESATFETSNLSVGTDTVINIWDGTDWTSAAYNDDYGSSLRSRATVTNTASYLHTYYIIVTNHGSNSGTADLYKDGSLYWSQIPVEGETVGVPCGEAYDYETVKATGSTKDLMLFGFGILGFGRRLQALDFDNGVGDNARISGKIDVCNVIIGLDSWWAETAGEAHVYANDYWTDDPKDGDGLGGALESELGTCNSRSQPGCASCNADGDSHCAVEEGETYALFDSDNDGLRDDFEVFGVDARIPNYLPTWGADPLHKDAFVEIDWYEQSYPVTAEAIRYASSELGKGSAITLQNPDGLPGIRLHADIGVDATNAEEQTLYGDWGGASAVPTKKYKNAANDYSAEERRGIFRYGLAKSGGGGQGQTDGRAFVFQYFNGAHLVHEMGHTMALGHAGTSAWGAVNCKPNYRSVMNYAYQGDASLGYSQGAIDTVLNPAAVDETVGIGTSDNSWFEEDWFRLNVSGAMIDWNRNGTYESGKVRAPLTWARWAGGGCATFQHNKTPLQHNSMKPTTPSIMRLGSRLYVFWIGSDDTIYYRHGLIGSRSSGGCLDNQLGTKCMNWSETRSVRTGTAVSAVAWGSKMVLAFKSTTGNLYTISSLGTDSSGNFTGWTTPIYLGAMLDEPEAVEFDHADGARIGLFYRDPNGVFRTWLSAQPGGGWYRQDVTDQTGTPLEAGLSPTVATMSNGTASVHCGVFPNGQGYIGFYCYDKTTNRWTDLTGSAYSNGVGPRSSVKAGLYFHVPRDENGDPVNGDNTEGRFHLAIDRVKANEEFPVMWMSNPLSFSSPPDPNIEMVLNSPLYHGHFRIISGVDMYEDAEVSSLKMVMIGTGDKGDHLNFWPFADGTFAAELRDGNDFRVISYGLCVNLGGSDFCGPGETRRWSPTF
ncbi:MAG: hypothetical protein ACOCXM_03880 [Myxococcota bacterium]